MRRSLARVWPGLVLALATGLMMLSNLLGDLAQPLGRWASGRLDELN